VPRTRNHIFIVGYVAVELRSLTIVTEPNDLYTTTSPRSTPPRTNPTALCTSRPQRGYLSRAVARAMDTVIDTVQSNDFRVLIALCIVGVTSIALTLHWVLRTALPWFIGLAVRHRAISTSWSGLLIFVTLIRRARGRTESDGDERSTKDYSNWDF
jgi:hypothetical protein